MNHHQHPTAIEIVAAVRARPEEAGRAAQSSLKAIEAWNPKINAFIEDRPRGVAAEARGPGRLAGVPVAVKDMFVDRGRPPTVGSNVVARLQGTATILERLRAEGAEIVGYTNLHEWGIGTTSAVTATGPIRNPWDLERIAGGSSGGSAAALAAGVVPAAVGTDAGGSIRIPAACCGVVGLKPTWGLVPMDGFAVGEGPPVDHVGPMARSVADVRLLFEVLSGTDVTSPDVLEVRLGVARASLFDDVDPEITQAIESCLALLRHEVTSIGGVELVGAASAGSTLAAMLLSHTSRLLADDLRERPEAFQPATLNVLMLGQAFTEDDLAQAELDWLRIRASWDDLFDKVDVVVTPTLSAPPPKLDHLAVELPSGGASADLSYVSLNAPMNLGGVPALSLPCGETSDGWTVNLTLSAARGRDELVLAVGERIEQLLDRHYVDRVAPLS